MAVDSRRAQSMQWHKNFNLLVGSMSYDWQGGLGLFYFILNQNFYYLTFRVG